MAPTLCSSFSLGFRTQVINDICLQPAQRIKLALLRDVVAVATPRRDPSGADAAAPVDVVEMSLLALTGAYTDNTQLLNYAVPSLPATATMSWPTPTPRPSKAITSARPTTTTSYPTKQSRWGAMVPSSI